MGRGTINEIRRLNINARVMDFPQLGSFLRFVSKIKMSRHPRRERFHFRYTLRDIESVCRSPNSARDCPLFASNGLFSSRAGKQDNGRKGERTRSAPVDSPRPSFRLFSLYGTAIGRRGGKRNYKYARKTELSAWRVSFSPSPPFFLFPKGTRCGTPTSVRIPAGVRVTLAAAIIIRYF